MLNPTGEKRKKKLEELLKIHHQYNYRNGCALRDRQRLANQAQPIAALALDDFPLDGIALRLVSEELLRLLSHQIWIAFGPAKPGTTQPEPMAHTELTIAAYPIDLIGTDNGRVMSVTSTIRQHLRLQVFSFVVGVVAQTIEEGKSITCDRD
jgi:hypothetical protein